MSFDATRDAGGIAPDTGRGGRRRALLGQILLSLASRLARRAGLGCIDITLPNGARSLVGEKSGAAIPVVEFRTWRAVRDFLFRGSLGFAEAFIDGRIDVADLETLFEYVLDNDSALSNFMPRLYKATRSARHFHKSRANTRTGSRENIAAHYDLGNEFYAAWLDSTMLYSSGIYRRPDDSLETAQHEKLDRIFDALAMEPGGSLLEIGCGWGEVATEATRRGASVKAITISAAQKSWTEKRVAELGLAGTAEIVLEDYRDLTGAYDRIVSIEMIEAVGEENWPAYFSTLAQRLKPDGRAIVQAITIDEPLFDHYRANPDFIQRFIFPGGMLPTIPRMEAQARAVGLQFETVERFGQSYARTLEDWRARFEAAWPMINGQQGFDERFRRMWLYYLIYCEVGFRRQFIDVGLYRLTKAGR